MALSKHQRTMFVYANARGAGEAEEFHYVRAVYATETDIDKFLAVVAAGGACLDLAIHVQPDGAVRDHGFLFRIHERELPRIFRRLDTFDLHP